MNESWAIRPFFLVVTVIFLSAPPAVRADTAPPAKKSKAAAEEPVRKKLFKGFGYAKKLFKDVCVLLEADGRREAVRRLASANAARDESCTACRPLFLMFEASCVGPKKPKGEAKAAVKEEESGEDEEGADEQPAPTPIPKNVQREPSAEVANGISILFREIASREDDAAETYKAAQKLVVIFRDKRNKRRGEAEYLDILSEYVLAPFHTYLVNLEKRKRYDAAAEKARKQQGWRADGNEEEEREADELFAF